ncbi:MAG TPA: hypothetical protein VIW03_17115 [Anaeromyxobacter sp.]
MSSNDGSRPATAGTADPRESRGGMSSSAGRFAELVAGMAPIERIERLQVLETLSCGTVYEGRLFHASRAETVSLLEVDPAFEVGSAFPLIVSNLLAASRLRGPHILSPRALYRDGDSLYALYDTHAGLNLATGFDFLARSGLRLSSEAVLRLASGVLSALDEIEREESGPAPAPAPVRSHGLLIPENVIVTEDQKVLVRGFGIWPSEIARVGLLGPRERRYLAPAQTAQGTASPRSDLASLGAILFEAAAGYPAFDAAPTESDVADLGARIEEMRTGETESRREVLGLALTCLTMAATPASRARLRVAVDTLFLREAAAERTPGLLSLEELASRVRAARPAIVKAIALDLDPVEEPPPPRSIPVLVPPPPEAKPLPLPSPSPPPPPADTKPAEAPVPPRAEPALPAAPALLPPQPRARMLRLRTVAILAGAAVLAAAAFLSLGRSGRHRPEPAPPAAPVEGNAAATDSSSAFPSSPPTPAEAASPSAGSEAPSEPPASDLRLAAAPPVSASTAGTSPVRETKRAARRRPAARPAKKADASRGTPSSAPAPAAPPPEGETGAEAPPPGTLVEPGTPGLVPPAVAVRPDDPRLFPPDARAAAGSGTVGSIEFQLLVDERGRVVDHRVLGATSFPVGISSAVARYLADLRFQPADFRGAPVRVWVRHEMRFLAP